MKKKFRYEKEDWIRFQSFLEKDLLKSTRLWYERVWFKIALWLAMVAALFSFLQSGGEFSWVTAGIVSFFFVLVIARVFLVLIKFKNLCAPSEGGCFIGEHSFEFDEEGIHSEGKGYRSTHSWRIVKRMVKTEKAVYLFWDSASAHVFPLSQISDAEEFCAYLDARLKPLVS